MMEAFALYLFKSVIWISGFALVFILFLRNERYFVLNRIYLIAGILTAFIFPLISIHYSVAMPVINNIQSGEAIAGGVFNSGKSIIPFVKSILCCLYALGVVIVIVAIVKQGKSVLHSIKKSEIIPLHPIKLIKTPEYTSSFSFFSYVFVNPSITDIETREIMNHELAHVRQKHWVDLVLVELLCILQWFNPLVWIYVRFIRQNHEYLADEVALQQTSDPAVYKAVLLNQIVGGPVVSLTNSFNYSLNKKRFNMMKNIISSPYRKMKVLLILPVFAVVLYSFAKPDYRYKGSDEKSGNINTSIQQTQNEVRGTVVMNDGSALPGANITIQNTTIGTITDDNGAFKIINVPDNEALVVSFVGFKSKLVKPDFKSMMRIEMVKDTLKLSNMNISTPPPPPPPSKSGTWELGENGQEPLYVVDGKITSAEDLKKIDPASIESISVLKKSSDKYGSKGKNGVVEVTLKKGNNGDSKQLPEVAPSTPPPPPAGSKNLDSQAAPVKDPFVVIEELPEFIGGKTAMAVWINSNLKYPVEAYKNKITGEVQVSFTVTTTGKIKNAVVSKPVAPLLDAEAVRVVSSMPDWKPGTQGGKSVQVQMLVPVEFRIN